MPQKNENEIVAGDASIVAKPGKQFFASAALVCVVFFIWVFVYVVNINGMYPTFLQDVKGMSVFDSSMLPNSPLSPFLLVLSRVSSPTSSLSARRLWSPSTL